jgi:hypothetical protein
VFCVCFGLLVQIALHLLAHLTFKQVLFSHHRCHSLFVSKSLVVKVGGLFFERDCLSLLCGFQTFFELDIFLKDSLMPLLPGFGNFL